MLKINRVLRELPKDVRDNGEEILHAILCGPSQLNWNHQLRLIVDGRVKQKTNIVELVEHLLYPEREDVDTPNGFDVFVNELSHIGLESHWVKNEYAKEKLDENERMYDTASSDAEQSDNESEHESNENSDRESNDDQESNWCQDEDHEMQQEQAPINWTIFSRSNSSDDDGDDNESEQECRLSFHNKNNLNRHMIRKHVKQL